MWKPRPRRSGERRAALPDDGSVSIELVIVLPALFALMFLGVQAALVHHARTVAIAAATEGARAAGGERGTAALGQAAASDFLADVGSDAFVSASATSTRTTTTATVVVEGLSLSVLPFTEWPVEAQASVSVERLTAGTP